MTFTFNEKLFRTVDTRYLDILRTLQKMSR